MTNTGNLPVTENLKQAKKADYFSNELSKLLIAQQKIKQLFNFFC